MESYHKRKHILEETYGKLLKVKPFNNNELFDNTQLNNISPKISGKLRKTSESWKTYIYIYIYIQ